MNQMQIDPQVEEFIQEDYAKLKSLIKKFRDIMDKAEHHTRFEFIWEMDAFMASRIVSLLKGLNDQIQEMLQTNCEDTENAPYPLALQAGKELSEEEAEKYLSTVRKKANDLYKDLDIYMKSPFDSKEDDTMSGTKTFFINFEEHMKSLDEMTTEVKEGIMTNYSLHANEGYGMNYPFLLVIEELKKVFRDYYLSIQQFETLL